MVTGGAGFDGALMGVLQDRKEDAIQLSRVIGY
jgi:hypothetical protein